MLPEITQEDIQAIRDVLPENPSREQVQDIAERLLLRLHASELLAAVTIVQRIANLQED
jgi:hypothetical protein